MIKERMTDIKRNGLIVLGEWEAEYFKVAPVDLEPYEFYGEVLMKIGFTESGAMSKVNIMVQNLFTAGMRHHLRMFIMDQAEKYAEAHPEAVKNITRKGKRYRTAHSFKPELVQSYYFPGGEASSEDRSKIKGDGRSLEKLFEEMAKDV